jgi:DNA helicase HerA-like ATPase
MSHSPDEVGAGTDTTGGEIVGTVVEPGDGPNEFVFVTPDEQTVKTGEFVTYTVAVEDDERTVIARVTNREQSRGLPASFMADPTVAPDTVAATLGVPNEDVDLYRLTATVVGFYDGGEDGMKTFSNPRQLPRPGARLRTAADELLEAVLPNLGVDDPNEADPAMMDGLAHVGWLLNRPTEATNLHLPIDEFAATHLAILASTGSGKSYTASVLIEEMMQPSSRASMLVFDPHGEYDTLADMQGTEFRGKDGYSPEVEYFKPDRLRVRISELELGDVMAVLDNPSNRMQQRLKTAWNNLQRRDSKTWGVDELVAEMESEFGEDDPSVGALDWRLDATLGSNDLFQPDANVPLDDLVAPGTCTVLQMDTLNRRNQQMIATVLLRRLYQARLDHERGRESAVDFPLFALFEEGHRFAPSAGSAPSLGIMRTITSEGRKFGFGIGVVSQRPSKIDGDTLSQCGTQITMQIQNPADRKAIEESVEAAGEAVLDELPGLTPGQAVLSGDAMNTPVLVRVRERHTEHGAAGSNATEAWRESYAARQREPVGSESPDMGGGESSGVDEL